MGVDRRFLNVRLSVRGVVNDSAETVNGIQFIVGAVPAGNFAGAATNDIAVYDGYKNAWGFYKPAVDMMEIMNIAAGQYQRWNGTAWENIAAIGGGGGGVNENCVPPVINIVATGTSTPANAAVGDIFLNTDTGTLFTATGVDTWNAGVTTSDGDRYASKTNGQIYTRAEGAFAGVIPVNGSIFMATEPDTLYIYDGGTTSFLPVGLVPDATYTSKGKVSVSNTGGLKVDNGVISVQRRTLTIQHTLTSSEVSARSFTLPHAILTGSELSVAASVGGVAQVAGVDFTVLNTAFSWEAAGLGTILETDDVFIVTYTTDAA